MNQEIQDSDRCKRRKEWLISILVSSSNEDESDAESGEETKISYPVDTGQAIALRFPYPMLSDESEEEDDGDFLDCNLNEKRKLSCSSESISSLENMNYKHKRRKKNLILYSEDSDEDCNKYLSINSFNSDKDNTNCRTEMLTQQKSSDTSNMKNRLYSKSENEFTDGHNSLYKKLTKRVRGRKSRENVDLFGNSYLQRENACNILENEFKTESRFLDSSSENDEPSQQYKRPVSKYFRLRVLSTSPSCSDSESGDVIKKQNFSRESISPPPHKRPQNSYYIDPDYRPTVTENIQQSKVESKHYYNDPDYIPAIKENDYSSRKKEYPALRTKSLLSNNNSNAWKNIPNENVKVRSRQFSHASKVQNLKKMLLSRNMSAVEVHKKIYSKPINVGRIKETSAKPNSSKMKRNESNKSESNDCTGGNIPSVCTKDKQKDEAITNNVPLNKQVHVDQVNINLSSRDEVDSNDQSAISHIDDLQPNREEINTTIDDEKHIPTSNKRIRHSHYTSKHHNQIGNQYKNKNIHINRPNTENKTLHESECKSHTEERIDILGNIMSEMDRNPFRVQKLPSEKVAQPTPEMITRGSLGQSFDSVGHLANIPNIKSQIPDKENIQSRQNHPPECFMHNNLQSLPQSRNQGVPSGAVISDKQMLNLPKSNHTDINTHKLSTKTRSITSSSNLFNSSPTICRVEGEVIKPFYSAQSHEYVPNSEVANDQNFKSNINCALKKGNASNSQSNQVDSCLSFSQEKDRPMSNYCNNKQTGLSPSFAYSEKLSSTAYSHSKRDFSNKPVNIGLNSSIVNLSDSSNCLVDANKSFKDKSDEHDKKTGNPTSYIDRIENLIKSQSESANIKDNNKEYPNTNKDKKVIENSNQKLIENVAALQSNVSKSMKKPNKAGGASRNIAKTNENANKNIKTPASFRVTERNSRNTPIDNTSIMTKAGIKSHSPIRNNDKKYKKSLINIKDSHQKQEKSITIHQSADTSNNEDDPVTIGGKKINTDKRKELLVKGITSDDTEKSKGIRIRVGGNMYRWALPGSKGDTNNTSVCSNANVSHTDSTCSAIDINTKVNSNDLAKKDDGEKGQNSTKNNYSYMYTNNNTRVDHSISSSDDSCDSSSSDTSTSSSQSSILSDAEDINSCKQETNNASIEQKHILERSCLFNNDFNAKNVSSEKSVVVLSDSNDSEKQHISNENDTDRMKNSVGKAADNVKFIPKAQNVTNVGKIRVKSLKELGAVNNSPFVENALSNDACVSTSKPGTQQLKETSALPDISNISQENVSESEKIVTNKIIKESSSSQPFCSNLDTLFNKYVSKSSNKNHSVDKTKVLGSSNDNSIANLGENNLNSGITQVSKNSADDAIQLGAGPSIERDIEVPSIQIPTPVVVSKEKSQENALKLIQVPLATKDTEQLFFHLCDNLFTDLLYCKIPKLVDDLHLLILYDCMREERLKKISQLSCNETIAVEKRRIEKEFSDHLKVRSFSFVPLFMTIVNKINKSDYRALVVAVYCRITQHLERVDKVNASYRFKARFIIKNMLEKSNCEGHKNLIAIFGQSDADFLPTFVFIENLLQKYDRCVEERQKQSSDRTPVSEKDTTCSTADQSSSAVNLHLPVTSSASTAKESISSDVAKSPCTSSIPSTSQISTNSNATVSNNESGGKDSMNGVTKQSTPTSIKPIAPAPIIGNLDQMLLFKLSSAKKANS